jgi:hypothetical protein
MQATWYSGQTLAHTIFTCYYVHNTELLEHPTLKSYAVSLLRTCDIIRRVVSSADVCAVSSQAHSTQCKPCERGGANIAQEEDFISNSFGLSLGSLPPKELIEMLRLAENELSSQADPIQRALLHRIRLRRWFSSGLLQLNKVDAHTLTVSRKSFETALQALDDIQQTHNLGSFEHTLMFFCLLIFSLKGASFDEISSKNVFIKDFIRRLSIALPVRKVTVHPFDESIAIIRKIIENFLTLTEIPLHPSIPAIFEFLRFFSLRNPDIITRSKLRSLLLQGNQGVSIFGKIQCKELVLSDMKASLIPQQQAEWSDAATFAERAAIMIAATFKV